MSASGDCFRNTTTSSPAVIRTCKSFFVAGLEAASGLFDRRVALVVKASASREANPGFDSRLRRGDFLRVESYQ